MPMISRSSGGSSSFNTCSESAICGTALGETNDTASRCLNPAPISARRYCVLVSAEICCLRPCHASRGHSISLIDIGKTFFTTEARSALRKERLKNSSLDTAGHSSNVKVHKKSDLLVAQPHVCQQLRFVHWEDPFDRLEFEHYFFVDENVDLVPAIQCDAF